MNKSYNLIESVILNLNTQMAWENQACGKISFRSNVLHFILNNSSAELCWVKGSKTLRTVRSLWYLDFILSNESSDGWQQQ